jgi:CHAT domain/AAA ATPase domain
VNLLLAAVDVAGPLRWRWELRDEGTGEALAEHHVSLDGQADADQVTAFGDLHDYVRWHADPLWDDDEPRIVRETGAWARDAVLGEAIVTAITAAAPATVLVSVPPPADQALLWPLELAYADGAPLAARGDVSFVYCLGRPGAVPAPPMGPVRVLAAFSQPTGTSAIALRRERYELAELIRRMANRDAAVELRVLQYGVTRQRLSEVIGSGGGWDVVHLSGHGNRAGFALERSDGSEDFTSTADLVNLLRPALGRLKLAVLSSCNSAGEAATDRPRLLGLPDERARPGVESAAGRVSGLARGVAEELGCAVVATRYPVYAEFLTAFNRVFYDRMLSGGQPAAVACTGALAAVLAGAPAGDPGAGDGPAAAVHGEPVPLGLPAVTLAVFGANAARLVLRAVPGDRGAGGTRAGQLAGFPGQPERFVGRDEIMTAATAALRRGSGISAILLPGMPGIGKTACALELAYLHQDQFGAAAYWRPPAGRDPGLVLQSLADALRGQLGEAGAGFASPPRWGRRRWDAYARRLRESLRASRVLLVLDNLEELLGPGGEWQDRRVEAVFGALSGHGGESRLVATSRFAPASSAPGSAGHLLTLPVGPLPRADMVILARQLPVLGALLSDGQAPGPGQTARAEAGRRRAGEALDRVAGHPGLLELDDAAVSAQAAPLARAERERVERSIGEWAAATLAVAPDNVKLMAWFVAGLEPRDRRLPVINATWAGLWRRLGQPGTRPDSGPLLDALSAALLTGPDDHEPGPLHPVVAAVIRRETPANVRDAADTELAAGWTEDGGRAEGALAALPYLTRRRDWNGAAALLDRVLRHGTLPAASADGYLPDLRPVSRFTTAPAASAALALALWSADPAGARRLLQGSLDSADSAGDYPLAWVIAGHLADALRDAGHLDQALDVAARQEHYGQAAGLGPWTRLAGHSRRLVVLARMERYPQVLAELSDVRERLRRLTGEETNGELPSIVPSAVREQVLDTARLCAMVSGKWQAALNADAEILDSQRQRGASRHERAIARLFDAYPLIRLRRFTEAAAALVECQQAFEDEGDTANLSHVFTGRADLEATLDHADNAVRFARSALRMTYTRTIPDAIAAAHQRLAVYLRKARAPAEEQQAHWLAAALLSRLSGRSGGAGELMHWAPHGLRDGRPLWFLPGVTDLHPWTVARVTDTVEQTRGIHLAELITAIEPDADTVARELTAILELATGPAGPAAAVRATGRQLFGNLGGYGLAADPLVSQLANRFHRWLEAKADQEHQPDQEHKPEAGGP